MTWIDVSLCAAFTGFIIWLENSHHKQMTTLLDICFKQKEVIDQLQLKIVNMTVRNLRDS